MVYNSCRHYGWFFYILRSLYWCINIVVLCMKMPNLIWSKHIYLFYRKISVMYLFWYIYIYSRCALPTWARISRSCAVKNTWPLTQPYRRSGRGLTTMKANLSEYIWTWVIYMFVNTIMGLFYLPLKRTDKHYIWRYTKSYVIYI